MLYIIGKQNLTSLTIPNFDQYTILLSNWTLSFSTNYSITQVTLFHIICFLLFIHFAVTSSWRWRSSICSHRPPAIVSLHFLWYHCHHPTHNFSLKLYGLWQRFWLYLVNSFSLSFLCESAPRYEKLQFKAIINIGTGETSREIQTLGFDYSFYYIGSAVATNTGTLLLILVLWYILTIIPSMI